VQHNGKGQVIIEGINTTKQSEHTRFKLLDGCIYTPIRDRIIAGTYLVAGAITCGDITVCGLPKQYLKQELKVLQKMGFDITTGNDCIRLIAKDRPRPTNITTAPYPHFATDLQAQFMALAALSNGTVKITETVFENRLNTAEQLIKMGADIKISFKKINNSQKANQGSMVQFATINGVDTLQGAQVFATDLRGGAALVLAGLSANGATTINNINYIDRGYYQIEKDLQQVGGNITRVQSL